MRTALVRLEHEGLVEREPNRGAKVRLVDEQEAAEILESRMVLEGLAARHAAANVTPAQVDELRAILAQMRSLLDAGDLLGVVRAERRVPRTPARDRRPPDRRTARRDAELPARPLPVPDDPPARARRAVSCGAPVDCRRRRLARLRCRRAGRAGSRGSHRRGASRRASGTQASRLGRRRRCQLRRTQARSRSVSPRARALLRGAYDMHVHVAPDVVGRRIDDLTLARRFSELGLAGFQLKSHYASTAERAAVVRAAVPGVDVLGAISPQPRRRRDERGRGGDRRSRGRADRLVPDRRLGERERRGDAVPSRRSDPGLDGAAARAPSRGRRDRAGGRGGRRRRCAPGDS